MHGGVHPGGPGRSSGPGAQWRGRRSAGARGPARSGRVGAKFNSEVTPTPTRRLTTSWDAQPGVVMTPMSGRSVERSAAISSMWRTRRPLISVPMTTGSTSKSAVMLKPPEANPSELVRARPRFPIPTTAIVHCLVDAQGPIDLDHEIPRVVARSPGAERAEQGEVLAHLGGVDGGQRGQLLRGDGGDVGAYQLGQDPLVDRQAHHSGFGNAPHWSGWYERTRPSPGQNDQSTCDDVELRAPPRPHRRQRPRVRWSRSGAPARPGRDRRRSRRGGRRGMADVLHGEVHRAGGWHPGGLGIGQRGRQLQVAEVVDPHDLGPHAAPPVPEPTLLDHAAGDPHQGLRGRSDRPGPRAARPDTVRPPRERRGRGRRTCPAPGPGRRRSPKAREMGASPADSAAAIRSPLSGPTKKRGSPPGSVTSMHRPRRAEPTPGSTTARTTPGPRCGMTRTSVWDPLRTSKAGT